MPLRSHYPKVSRKEELNSDEEKEWEGYICKICDNEYVSKSGLAQHISLVHEGGKTKSYKCPICDGIFHQISTFKQHVKTVHEGRVCERLSCELIKIIVYVCRYIPGKYIDGMKVISQKMGILYQLFEKIDFTHFKLKFLIFAL